MPNPNYDKMTSEDFDRILAKIIDNEMRPASSVLSIPGIYEILSEHFNMVAELQTERNRLRTDLAKSEAENAELREAIGNLIAECDEWEVPQHGEGGEYGPDTCLGQARALLTRLDKCSP